MATEYHEQCVKCRWLVPELNPPCGRLFEAKVFISPLGGTVDIQTTPGLVPVQFQPQLEEMLAKVFSRVIEVIERWPGWKDLYEIQACNPEKTGCPGRDAVDVPYLRVVK